MKNKVILKGHVSYSDKTMYKWVADFGENTCKTCAAMDGKMFEKDKVPYWPHPNCRCRVEEVSVIDVIESEMHDYKEEIEQLLLQANELLGDSHVLEERVNKLEKEFDDEEILKIARNLNHIQCLIYKLIDFIESLNGDTAFPDLLMNIEKEIDELRMQLQKSAKEYRGLDERLKKEKFIVDTVVYLSRKVGEDAAALWELSSSKFTRGLDYIKNNNGKIIDKVSDLKNKKLEEIVRKKLQDQIKRKEARGLWLPANSTLAKSLSNSSDFKRVLNEQNRPKILLEDKKEISEIKTSIGNNLWTDTNNYLAIHGCDILNVRVENNILYATILDTVDYNKGDFKVKLPRDLQEAGAIENYYILIEIAEPIEKFFDL